MALAWVSMKQLCDHFQSQDRDAVLTEEQWCFDLVHWLIHQIDQPHPALCRPGAVCPCVRQALRQDQVFLKTCTLSEDNSQTLADFIWRFLQKFFLENTPEVVNMNKSLIIAFPSISLTRASVLQNVRKMIKPELLRRDLTCGEFYPESEDCSARNEDFYVGRAPVPCLVIRYLAPHDALFLHSQPELFEIYRRRHPDWAAGV